jgi:hypothetical protein
MCIASPSGPVGTKQQSAVANPRPRGSATPWIETGGQDFPIPKFASICSDLCANFGIEKDTRNATILVSLLNPKFATVPAAI